MVELPSRRDRLREDTLAEIKTVARRQLVESGPAEIHLRAIARQMGMTAPGLYRYFSSLQELITALIVDCYDEAIAEMQHVRDQLPPNDLLGRLLAVSRAFRWWSVAHPAEFQLIFGAPPPGFAQPPEGPAQQAGERFGDVFRAIFTQIWMRRPFRVPETTVIHQRLRAQLQTSPTLADASLPAGAVYMFLSCWVRLYGLVALEVFGHIQWAVEEGDGLFETELREISQLLGMVEDYRAPQ